MTDQAVHPSPSPAAAPLRKTPLHAEHVKLSARMAPFAGYEMPIQYPPGILEEHAWTRSNASVFDISHMGQAHIVAADGHFETAAAALEALVPADILGLAPGQQRYTQLLNDAGGIIDDLIVTRPAAMDQSGEITLVLNASRKDVDGAHIAERLGRDVALKTDDDRALIALQGPKAGEVLEALCPASRDLKFMQAKRARVGNYDCHVSRSGYTGEDGFEISVQNASAVALWQALLARDGVHPCGLGARDSLRLEAGLCLYGHELDETISPIEAGLAWSLSKRRREQHGFPGSARLARELADGTVRRRVGIMPDGRAPARDGTEIQSESGAKIGIITSGGFSPTLKRPVAMGFVTPEFSKPGTAIKLIVRGAPLGAKIAALPFVRHGYRR